MSLQLSQAKKIEARLTTEGQIQAEHMEHLEASLKQAREENEFLSLLSQVGALEEEVEPEGLKSREATMAQLKLEEVLAERGQWEEERERWTSKVAELEKELAGAQKNVVEAERLCAVPSHCLEPSSWEDEKVSLEFKAQALQGENTQLVSHVAELEREVEEARSDGQTESEILQARISELTQENAGVASTCKELKDGIENLKTQLGSDGKEPAFIKPSFCDLRFPGLLFRQIGEKIAHLMIKARNLVHSKNMP